VIRIRWKKKKAALISNLKRLQTMAKFQVKTQKISVFNLVPKEVVIETKKIGRRLPKTNNINLSNSLKNN
jgi:hypothetical protein